MRLEPEELLLHTDWMTTLARSLVLDESTAQDVVQEAVVEVIERAPQRPRSPVAWLGAVVCNLARRDHRSSVRRRRRETAAARREVVTPLDAVARAELHRIVVDRVLALPEPYRGTVLLRYFEDLSVTGIAARQGVAAPTVRSRLQRGLDRLRRDLDAVHGGDHARWLAGLTAIAGLQAARASSAATGAAGSPLSAAPAGAPALTIGGAIVTSKTVVTLAVLNLGALLLGAAIGRSLLPVSLEDAKSRFHLVEAKALAALESRLTDLQAAFESAGADRKRLEGERDDLRARVESLAGALEGERSLAAASAIAPGPRQLALTFGSFSDLEALTGADWREIATTIKALNGLLLELQEAQEKGEPTSQELQQKLAEENGRLMRFYTGLMGKLPTHSPWGGEFSHPLVLANLFDAVLAESGLPLTSSQKTAIERAGSGFDAAYDQLQETYAAETPRLEKLADELALKEEHAQRFRELLTSEQLEAAVPPRTPGQQQYDLLSPDASTVLGAQALECASAGDAHSRFRQKLLEDLGIDPALAGSLDGPFAAWQQEIAPLLVPRTEAGGRPGIKEKLQAARAEAALLKQILAVPGLDERTRSAIIGRQSWIVPHVTAKAP